MDSPPKPLEMSMGELEADGRLHLPPNLTTVMAGLVLAADHEAAILIDAADTTSIGQAALQLLIAARQEADRMNIPFGIANAREPLVRRIEALGLAEMLGLAGKGESVQ